MTHPAAVISSDFSLLQSLFEMLRLLSTASGEELAALDASEFDALADRGSTVGALKRHLAASHFEGKYTRFQLRILRGAEELEDEESIAWAEDLQLILLNHLPADEERDKVFMQSCKDGLVDEVDRRLRGLQDPNVQDEDGAGALFYSAHGGYLELCRLLLDAGADREATDEAGLRPLHPAAEAGHVDVVRLLLDAGAEVDAADEGGDRPLHEAVCNGRLEVVWLLLAAGADRRAPNHDGEEPKVIAALRGHEAILGLLEADH